MLAPFEFWASARLLARSLGFFGVVSLPAPFRDCPPSRFRVLLVPHNLPLPRQSFARCFTAATAGERGGSRRRSEGPDGGEGREFVRSRRGEEKRQEKKKEKKVRKLTLRLHRRGDRLAAPGSAAPVRGGPNIRVIGLGRARGERGVRVGEELGRV